ncbi:MAG: Mur ligase domain-containing protein [Candidatus Marinimicrobia bacterium]|nr:Mur ligase domain-containing protein [Candidatus Neomarinimicrobiota bacterium]
MMKTEQLHHGPFVLRNIRFDFFRGVSIDSRNIPEAHIFCALKGEHTDGHRFVKDALKNGALAAVVNSEYAKTAGPEEALIVVEDTLRGLKDMATIYARSLHVPVFAITGSGENLHTTAFDRGSAFADDRRRKSEKF